MGHVIDDLIDFWLVAVAASGLPDTWESMVGRIRGRERGKEGER